MGDLQPLDDKLNRQCREFAEALRELFAQLSISLRRCAVRCCVSPGTLSRYLSGTRIAPQDFIDDLVREIEREHGTRIEPAALERLRLLRRAAVRTTDSISQAVHQLEDQLKAADARARSTSARRERLDSALDGQRGLLADLDRRLKRLEADHRADAGPTALPAERDLPAEHGVLAEHGLLTAHGLVTERDLLAERDLLVAQVADLISQLEEARAQVAFAEMRCDLLERQLAVVDTQRGAALPGPELVTLVEPHTGPPLPGAATPPPKVLLVDDKRPNLLALEAVLGTSGHQVVSVSSGPEALKALLETDVSDFAVIILDVQMPGMDGYETAAHIKRRARTRDIPIIFLTAVGNDPEYSMRGYAAGAVDFIVKPFDPWALRAKVAVFVEIFLERRLYASPRD
ncbi:response regulator receiver domain-containing protein [Kitasatospora sp. SolWspMP-SS2h]|uniref:response regulator n=1 Tax=Kitasatospora sp. SolWspMP-SS2h TaxID=1305729 RepID=UPI000DBA1503|nr:response regulator [Kitasatospora sp. SolWspMP-SS2h]RAJ31236.1 response regulator receiver domain-containing protein [Kitasatospora sp. SolWspMP-SS2h]